jgi:hypothetical protein
MSSSHLDELLLTSYLDGELEAARAMHIREHLDGCEACRKLMAETESVLRAFQTANRQSLPAPPQPWADLEPRLKELDAGQRAPSNVLRARPPVIKGRSQWWWAAAAASIAAGVIAVRLSTEQTVSAAELLEKASARDTSIARVQVLTSKGGFVRTAGDRGKQSQELEQMFREANFDWNEPLRARAFADWRNTLSNKEDDVRVVQNPKQRIGRFYRIRTSTPQGSLSEVSIMIRAADFRAVEERFEFRNREWVEISDMVPEAPPASSMAQSRVDETNQTASAQPLATATDELRAYAALHRIGADLGEPVEIRRTERSIEVTVLGASSRREREIREALSDLPKVNLQFEQPQAVKAPATESAQATEEAPAGPLHSRLLSLMGSAANVEAFTNAALEASEAALARAHALRQIAGRFAAREQLEQSDREMLRSIEGDHAKALRESVRRLAQTLHPLTGTVDTRAGGPPVDAQVLLGAAQRLDTLLSVALASAGANEEENRVVDRIRQAFGELDRAAREYVP